MPKTFKPKVYIKDESFDPFFKTVNRGFLFRAKVYPVALVSLGVFILVTQVILPLIHFKTSDEISKPASATALGVASGFRSFEFKELGEDRGEALGTSTTGSDTKPSFGKNSYFDINGNTTTTPEYFYLTIPKLNIKDALVEINAPTLNPDKALGHYAGSGIPGEVGNAFIYGHSVLPWFYNPKNYKAIFSTLDTLVTGDVFYITYNGRELKYKVETSVIAKPEDVDPLAETKPKFLNESTATLMTCVPPGTKMKRLMVNGILVRD